VVLAFPVWAALSRVFFVTACPGALSVSWVLDDPVVGDNDLDWVTPVVLGVRSARCFEAVQRGRRRACEWKELSTAGP
jgi:hypothetical protein